MTGKVKSGLEYRRLGSEGLILDTQTGQLFRLSPTAVRLWERLNGDNDCPEAVVMFAALGLVEGSDHSLSSAVCDSVEGVSMGQAFLATASSCALVAPANTNKCNAAGCSYNATTRKCTYP